MISRDIIQQILEAGVRAPSGENSQPWLFTVDGDVLSLYNIPERDLSLYNFNQFGSYVAHGALIENIEIVASSFGYAISVELFPSAADINYVARIIFAENTTISPDALHEYIGKRVSNRTAYQAPSFSEGERKALLNAGKLSDLGGRIIFIENLDQKKKVAEALSYADQLLFENTHLHDFLFGHIHWTIEEAKKYNAGFYVKELGLAPPQEMVFKLLRKDSWLRFFNKIGFPKMAARGNVSLYSTVSALGIIAMKNNNKTSFVDGGRIMERVWLSATQLGYSIQPLTAIIFFMQRVVANEAKDFSPEQIEGIKTSYAVIENEFGLSGETPVMLFRIGKGKAIAHQSLRQPPEIRYH